MKLLCLVFTVLFLTGCAGLIVHPLTKDQAADAHKAVGDGKADGKANDKYKRGDETTLSGYIVYYPMVVVEVINKEICVGKTKGKCSKVANVCGAGQIMYLPDYDRPYLVNSRSGLGKAGVEVQIKNGWMLSGLKDNSDNTAFLDKIIADSVVGTSSVTEEDEDKLATCKEAGLYKLTGTMELKKLQLWKELPSANE